jgi:hypothetical protein
VGTGDRHPDIDQRSELFVGLTREDLARVTASWPITANTPPDVAELLAESRRLFVGGAISYDNFAASSLKALQAADLALKHCLGFDSTDKRTMGQLISHERSHPVLDPETREWYSEFALHFRNELSHPERSVAFSPGLAEPVLRTCHERVAGLNSPEGFS